MGFALTAASSRLNRFAPLFLIVVILVAGCHKAPVTLQESRLLDAPQDEELRDTYWKRQSPPPLCDGAGRRLVIAEFGVQFVTQKMKALGIDQPIVGIPLGFVGVAIWLLGFERNNVVFAESTLEELPDMLYADFAADMQSRGFDVVPANTVTSAAAYSKLKTADERKSALTYQLNPAATDTGRMKAFTITTPDALPLINGVKKGEKIDEVAEMLRHELQADVLMRVLVRVGVYRGRATVEYDTRIETLTDSGDGTFQAIRSVISEDTVIDRNKWQLIIGETEDVNGMQYENSLRKLFVPFIGSAFGCVPADMDSVSSNTWLKTDDALMIVDR